LFSPYMTRTVPFTFQAIRLAQLLLGLFLTTSALDGASPDPDRVRGDAQFAKGDWQTAIVSYSRAIKTNPRNALALFQRARCYFRIGNNDAVIVDCSTAIPLAPPYLAEVFVLRGGAYSRKNNFPAALTDYRKATEIDPRSGRFRTFCGIAQFQMKQFKAALDDFNKAIELEPKLALALYHRGSTYEQLGNAANAMADWEKAIQLSPSYAKELQPRIDKLRQSPKP
jgi:tetratricopeptide (TPR) repeat protein